MFGSKNQNGNTIRHMKYSIYISTAVSFQLLPRLHIILGKRRVDKKNIFFISVLNEHPK